MPAEYQNPLASKDGLAPNKLTGPTELGVAARGSSGNAEEEGFPAGVNLSLHSAPSSAHLASGLFLGQHKSRGRPGMHQGKGLTSRATLL